MPRVIHFEIPAADAQRAMDFYTNVFGWEIVPWKNSPEYMLVTTGDPNEPGINGAIYHRNSRVAGDAATAFICNIDVDSVDEYIKKVLDNGGILYKEKKFYEGSGWVVYMKDPEGNTFGMIEADTGGRITKTFF